MEEKIIYQKLCKYCKKSQGNCGKCMSVLCENTKILKTYRCLNFERNEVENMNSKITCIRYTYYDEWNRHIAVVYKGTSPDKIQAFKSHYYKVIEEN